MKTFVVGELIERINEVLHMVEEEGETIEITNHREIIAHLVPVCRPHSSAEPATSAVWTDLNRLAAEIAAHLPEKIDAVKIARDVRREL
jgi:antitoxin (DNA-binding transcriptional repressor) of toxin-antitoxin stability system